MFKRRPKRDKIKILIQSNGGNLAVMIRDIFICHKPLFGNFRKILSMQFVSSFELTSIQKGAVPATNIQQTTGVYKSWGNSSSNRSRNWLKIFLKYPQSAFCPIVVFMIKCRQFISRRLRMNNSKITFTTNVELKIVFRAKIRIVCFKKKIPWVRVTYWTDGRSRIIHRLESKTILVIFGIITFWIIIFM